MTLYLVYEMQDEAVVYITADKEDAIKQATILTKMSKRDSWVNQIWINPCDGAWVCNDSFTDDTCVAYKVYSDFCEDAIDGVR